MDPITSLASGHIAGKVIDRVANVFRTNVIERWSKRRAQDFFEEFCLEVQCEKAGGNSDKLNLILDQMLENEHATDLLFDSYRRVSLSRSKTIGPRVIGIVTATLVLEDREPTEIELSMLDAAEQLFDRDLIEFSSFIREHVQYAENAKNKDVSLDSGVLRIKWNCEQFDSNWDRNTEISLAPLCLEEALGPWAPKLQSFGIIQTDITEKTWEYQEDSERHIDMDGSVREITWWILTSNRFIAFADMIDRVTRKADSMK